MAPIRERLRIAGPISKTNVQGNALAKLFRLPDSEAGFLATLQQFGLAVIVELLIVVSMIAFELMGRGHKPARAEVVPTTSLTIETPSPAPVLLSVPDRPRPKLAAATRQPTGSALDFLHDCTDIVPGRQTEMTDAFIGYSAWCKAKSLRTMRVADFVAEMERLCQQFGIGTQEDGDRHYLLNVQLLAAREIGSSA